MKVHGERKEDINTCIVLGGTEVRWVIVKAKRKIWMKCSCTGPAERQLQGGLQCRKEPIGNTVLRNVGIQPPYYTVQQPRKTRVLSSPPWKLQISLHN